MYKIEKNIPAPVKNAKFKYPFEHMEVGDSFFVPKKEVIGTRVSVAMNYYKKKNPKKAFMSRTDEAGVRVWRIK